MDEQTEFHINNRTTARCARIQISTTYVNNCWISQPVSTVDLHGSYFAHCWGGKRRGGDSEVRKR